MVDRIIIVDEEDNVVGGELRDIVDEKKLRYRVSALWVKNSKGENLLARRAYTKTHHPGKWGPAVAGTVEEGESYEYNIIKEAEEELGLKNIEVEKGPHMKISGQHNYFTQWFILKSDKLANKFKIQKDEVAEVKWFSNGELREQINNNPSEFLKNMGKYFELFC